MRRSDYEEKWLAVGDAAFSVDPLSASGISFALRSGCEGAMAIDRWLSGGVSRAKTYDVLLDREFNQYLEYHYNYYVLETRWPDSLFWERRSVLKRL